MDIKRKIEIIERWIGASPETGNLNREEVVNELINDLPGLKKYFEENYADGEGNSVEKKKAAVVVGHWETDKGAVSYGGQNEWDTRTVVAYKLQNLLRSAGMVCQVFFRPVGKGYNAAMKELGKKIDNFGADVAIELHFNSYDKNAHGAEFLCASDNGERLARCYAESWKNHYPEVKLRRDGGVYRKTGGNGYGFLTCMQAPACIIEPEFADNPKKWPVFESDPDKEALANFDAIMQFLGE